MTTYNYQRNKFWGGPRKYTFIHDTEEYRCKCMLKQTPAPSYNTNLPGVDDWVGKYGCTSEDLCTRCYHDKMKVYRLPNNFWESIKAMAKANSIAFRRLGRYILEQHLKPRDYEDDPYFKITTGGR